MGRCGDRLAPDGSTYFEPGCIGGAAMGMAYCTCATTAARLRRAKEQDDKIKSLENRIAVLEKQLKE